MLGSGSRSRLGAEGVVGMVAPVLEKAPALETKSAIIPSAVPRMVDRREAFVRMSRCWLYLDLGHSLRM